MHHAVEISGLVSIALVFPGQGAEEAEMGLALAKSHPRAKHLLELASDATKVDVFRAIERGGRALTRTDVLQPALVAVSLGAAYAIEQPIDVVIGHSLGELAAACFALGLDDETAIALAAERGRAMALAAIAHPGGMIAVTSLPRAHPNLVLAAHNAEDEYVLSGDEDAIARFARDEGGTRLRVSGAWHSPAMEPVVAPFRASLDRALANRGLRIPLLSAVTASLVSDDVADVLSRGLVSPVRWVETLRALAVDRVLLVPPGRLSRALVRRTLGTRLEINVVTGI